MDSDEMAGKEIQVRREQAVEESIKVEEQCAYIHTCTQTGVRRDRETERDKCAFAHIHTSKKHKDTELMRKGGSKKTSRKAMHASACLHTNGQTDAHVDQKSWTSQRKQKHIDPDTGRNQGRNKEGKIRESNG